jgi:glycosyltransferase involved in cell wall biosynthesis
MMAGLAVAVPRLPGMAPLVDGKGIGVTFEPGSPESLGAALSALAADRDGVARMAAGARRLAVEQYNAEAQSAVLVRAWGVI